MKIIIVYILTTILLSSYTFGQKYNVMTFNIRLDVESDGINRWDQRKEEVINFINDYKPDILGIQEGLHHQVSFLNNNLADHDFIGVGREDGKSKGEYSAVFYDKTKFSVLSDSTIWLSENPSSVSVGWDAVLERICTFGLFEDKRKGNQFWVFNTHYDHMGKLAREKSSELIIQTIMDINTNNLPLILTGDLNSTPESKPIIIISKYLEDSYFKSLSKPTGPLGTFTGFKEEAELKNRIDYIFTKGLDVFSVSHLNDRRKDGNFLSDHLPVMVELRF